MPEWREVMEAQAEARDALAACENYGDAIENGNTAGRIDVAILLAARAVCTQMAASSMAQRHAFGNRA